MRILTLHRTAAGGMGRTSVAAPQDSYSYYGTLARRGDRCKAMAYRQ